MAVILFLFSETLESVNSGLGEGLFETVSAPKTSPESVDIFSEGFSVGDGFGVDVLVEVGVGVFVGEGVDVLVGVGVGVEVDVEVGVAVGVGKT
jgi:hypothetical protein